MLYSKEELTTMFNRIAGQIEGITPVPVESTINIVSTPNGKDAFIDLYYKKEVPIEHIEMTFTVEKAPEEKEKTTLVLPDAHVAPGQDLSRFSALGNLIVARRPDNIISMGDFATLESLSAWDQGKAGKMEGRRYSEDCKACVSAIDLMLSPLRRLQARQKKAKEPVYTPRLIFLEGNHEDRIGRYVACKPELAEHLDIAKDLQLEESGFTDFIPYRGFIEIEGVLFAHAVMNAANQAVSGKTALGTIAQSVSKSVVIGHLHRFEVMNHYRHGAEDIIQIVSAGGFFEHVDDYADGGLNAYWRGLLILHHIKDKPGRFDIEQVSMERLKRLW